jgi:hypothetical protein
VTPRVCQLAETRTGLRIGIAYAPRRNLVDTKDALRLQSALLEKRTAQPVSVIRKVAGKVVAWL